MVFGLSVLNRVCDFGRVCPNYKQGIACPKQGNIIELVVLNRVCILGFFCPNQGQGFKPSAAHLYPNMGRVPPRDIEVVFRAFEKYFLKNVSAAKIGAKKNVRFPNDMSTGVRFFTAGCVKKN